MVSLKQIASYQKEMALGLGALALMLFGFGAAVNWTLGSYLDGAREEAEVELTGLALECAARIERDNQEFESVQEFVKAAGAGRAALYLFEQSSARSRASGAPAPIVNLVAQLDFSESVTNGFSSQEVYRYIRESYGDWELYHCPVYVSGQWKTLALVRECGRLAGLERASNSLLWAAMGILTLLLAATFTLFRSAAAPYQRIQSQAQSVGANATDAERAVEEVVADYRRTIAELQEKERSLVQLNRRLEDHISDVERVNEYLLSSMSTGVLILDQQGTVVGINSLALEWLGVEDSRLEAQTKEDYVGLFEHQPELKSRFDRALAEGCALEFEYELAVGGSTERTLGLSLIPLREEDDQLRELVALISDQTERVRAQRRLEDSRRLATLGEMSAGLAHQLRNSISAAMGFGTLAQKRIDDKATACEDIEALMRELHEEAALVERFLTYARPLSLSLESCELGEWLRESLSGSRIADRNEFALSFVAESRVEAEIDPLLLKQVIVNLVDNARKVIPEGRGEIVVSVRALAGNYRITISDNGPGISSEEREKIFTPFYSGTPSGVGLGLPLARRIVALHNGRLYVEDSAAGGAAFVIEAPLAPRIEEEVAHTTLSERPVAGD